MKTTFSTLLVLCATSALTQTLTLDQALKTALTNRSAVQAARLKVEEAQHSANALAAYPSLTLGAGNSTQEIGATDNDLFLSQQIDIFGRTSANQKLGETRVSLAQADLQETLLNVQTEVLKNYFEATAAQRISQVANELVEIARSLAEASQRRFEEGRIPEIQTTRALLELQRTQQTATLRKAQREAANKRLAASMGINDQQLQLATQTDPPSLSTIDLKKRPDLLRLAAFTQMAKAEETIAKRSRLPELELVALRSPWRQSPTEYGARLQITWSLLDYGKSKNQAKAAQSQAEAAQAAYRDAENQAQAELEALAIELQSATTQVKSYEILRASARDLVEKSQRGYSEGVGTLIDVLEATRALREIEEELAQAQLSLHLTEIARYQAAGTLLFPIQTEATR